MTGVWLEDVPRQCLLSCRLREPREGQQGWLSWQSARLACLKRWVQPPEFNKPEGSPELGRQREEDQKFVASLGYMMSQRLI